MALNQPRNGDIGGISGADYQCYHQSFKAGIKGIFRAFLSDKMQNVKNLLPKKFHHLPVVNREVICIYD